MKDAGKMVEQWYRELENKYPDKRCHEMVIMPNHFHYIIENSGAGLQLDNGGWQLGKRRRTIIRPYVKDRERMPAIIICDGDAGNMFPNVCLDYHCYINGFNVITDSF
jgi:REP element-mobilizing transposase RayT